MRVDVFAAGLVVYLFRLLLPLWRTRWLVFCVGDVAFRSHGNEHRVLGVYRPFFLFGVCSYSAVQKAEESF